MGPGLRLNLESLPFYRVKAQKTLNFAFVTLLTLRFITLIWPLGQIDFEEIAGRLAGINNTSQLLSALQLSRPQWLYLLVDLAVLFIAFLAAVFYAQALIIQISLFPEDREQKQMNHSLLELITALAGLQRKTEISGKRDNVERDNQDDLAKGAMRITLSRFLPCLPIFFLSFIFLLLLFLFSMFFFTLPFMAFASAFLFTFFLMMGFKLPLREAMRESRAAAYGAKAFMVMQFVTLYMLLFLVENLFLLLSERSLYGFFLIQSFFFACRTFIVARLWAIFYLIFCAGKDVKKSYSTAHL